MKTYTIPATAIEWHCAMMACKMAFDAMHELVPDAPSVKVTKIIGNRIAKMLKETAGDWNDEEKAEMQDMANKEFDILKRMKEAAEAEQTDGSKTVN